MQKYKVKAVSQTVDVQGKTIEKKIEKIINDMSLEEKVAFCSGKDFWRTKPVKRWKIPSVRFCDGPHGLRRQDKSGGMDMLGVNKSRPATCFPAEVTMAGSWDPRLLSQVGKAIAREAKKHQVDVVLGPAANVKRDPLCGRNFEYFSEDPYLSGKLAAGWIRGMESAGVGACLKHFACNNQELYRFTSNSVLDERTLREIYLAAFEIAVKEGRPSAVMSAYNKINGVHCSDNRWLLTDVLRGEWGFDGFVVTDWGGMNDRKAAFAAGCDLSMPGDSRYMERDCVLDVQAGNLSEACVDASIRRLLQFAYPRKAAGHKNAGGRKAHREPEKDGRQNREWAGAHHRLAVKAAREGAVLLKNDGLLPIREGTKIALIGHMAVEPRYQGSGSSHIRPMRLETAAQLLPEAVFARGCDRDGNTCEQWLAEAERAARRAKTAVVFAGLPGQYESEGFDRRSMKMPRGHIAMIRRVAAANPNTAVVLFCGGPVECPWADDVKAILYMGLPGQGGARAVKDLLYGRANPCGKLAQSWPVSYEDCPTAGFFGKEKDSCYREGIYVGYRYFDRAEKNVAWPFGFGLSYTSFELQDIAIKKKVFDSDGEISVTIAVLASNTGDTAGALVVQLYIAPPKQGPHRPVRELKGFQKVWLEPGETKQVLFSLDRRSFAQWQGGWRVQKGIYRICVGTDSRNLSLSAALDVPGETLMAPVWQPGSWYEHCSGDLQRSWENLMGRIYRPSLAKKGNFTMDTTIEEMKDHSLVMRIMYEAIVMIMARGGKGKNDPQVSMLINATVKGPLRNLWISSGLRGRLFEGLLDIANGQ